jgi:hypothetical protein
MIYGPKRNTFLVGKWKSSYRLISPFRHAISLFEMPTFFLEECQFGHKRPFFVILVIAKNNNTPHLTLATIFARHSIRFYGGMEREKTKSKTKIWHKMGGIDWQALDQHTQGLVHFQIIIFFFYRCRYHLFGQKGRGRSILWLSALPKFGFAGDEDIKSKLTV